MKFLKALVILSVSVLYAQDATVSIAPAPVSVDNIQGKGSEQRVDLSYMSYSTDNFDFMGLGVGYGQRSRDGDGGVRDWSMSFMSLSGSSGIYDIEGYNMGFNYLFGKELSNKNSIIYVGPTLSYTEIGLTVPYGTPTTEGVDIWTYTTLYGAQAGIQYEIPTSFGLFSPWAFANYMAGEVETEIYGSPYSDTVTDIDPILSTQFGFDLYFSSLGSSLSTMYQSNSDGDMMTFSYSIKF